MNSALLELCLRELTASRSHCLSQTPPPLPGLGLLLRTARNSLFRLPAGAAGKEGCTVADDLRCLISSCVFVSLCVHPESLVINVWKCYGDLEGDGTDPENNHVFSSLILYACPEIRGNPDSTVSISRACVFFSLDTEVFRVPDDASVKERMGQLSDTLACCDERRWRWALLHLERGQGQKALELPSLSPVLRQIQRPESLVWQGLSSTQSPEITGVGARAEGPRKATWTQAVVLGTKWRAHTLTMQGSLVLNEQHREG